MVLLCLLPAVSCMLPPGVCLAETPAPGLDPTKALTQLGLETWTTDHGLPNATVNDVRMTHEGYVWLATYDGLARFDGSRFTVFNRSHGLGSNGVRTLCEDRDGSLWVGTNGGGISRLSHGRFQRFTTADGLPSDIVWSLRPDPRDGSIWIGTNGGGLARYRNGRFEAFPKEKSGRIIYSIAQAEDGTLWLGTQADGLRRLGPDGAWSVFTSAEGLPRGLVASVMCARDGTLWGGTSNGLFRMREGRVVPLPPALSELGALNVSSLLEDDAGALWVGTNGAGIARVHGERVTFLGSKDGLGDVVYSLHLDRAGMLWIGTNGAGVSRLRDGSFTTFTAREGLSRDFTYCVYEDRSGILRVGTAGGLDRLSGGSFVPDSPPLERPVGIRSMAEGPDGSLWVGTYGAGVWRLREGAWRAYGTRDGLASDNVRAVLVDRSGRLWVATQAGLSALEGESWRTFRTAEGLPMDSLIGLAEDPEGGLWIGTDGAGLARYEGGRFQTFTARDGLASDLVLSLLLGSDGTLWVGTNSGLSRRAGARFTSYATAAGLPSEAVTQLAEDAGGDLWLGTSRGVSRVRRASLDRYAEGRSRELQIDTFDRLDGMKSSQCTAPGQPAALRSRDGRLWFPTTRGVATVDPGRMRLYTEPPTVVVEEVAVDGESVPFEAGVVVPPGRARIEFRYAALSPFGPHRRSVRFRLEGLDPDWVDAGDRRRADYTRVPPGDYVFRAAARIGGGPWRTVSAGIPLRVRPRFYQTPAFALTGAFALIGLVAVGHQVRVAGLRRRERELTRLVEERTRSLATQKERAERSHQEAQGARETAERLEAATRALSSTIDRRSVIDLILVELEKVVPYDSASIQELRRGQLEVIAGRGHAARAVGRSIDPASGDGRSLLVLDGRKPVIRQAAPYADGTFATKPEAGHRSWLGVPLLFGDRLIGMLALNKHEPGFYTEALAERAAAFGAQAAVAIENARLYGAVQDELAERTRAQLQLERSEARYRDLFEHSPALLCTHDMAGTILSVNPAAATSLGRSVEELLGHPLQQFIPAELRARFPRYIETLSALGGMSGTLVILDSKGDRKTWRYRNVVRQTPESAPFVIGFAQDVTEEEAAQHALRESEERFRQLAENIDAVFFIRSTEPTEFLYMSPAYERIWGRPAPESVDELLETVHPADREALAAAIARQREGYDVEYRIVRPDGATRWIRSRTFPVADRKGRVSRVAGIAEDVTERKAVEQMRDDLTHTLVHDLRNPLTSILVSMELLESAIGTSVPPTELEMVRLARRGGIRLRGLVDTILDVSRLEQGAMTLDRTAVELSEVVAEAFELQRPLARPLGQRLVNEVPGELPAVWADRGLLSRILQNLVGNAIKFTPAGGEIRVRAFPSGEEAPPTVRVQVSDTGPGIPEDVRDRLFEKFVTGRQKGRGSGLGLLFCKLAVEAQGGRIQAESQAGGGASFTFTLPRAAEGT